MTDFYLAGPMTGLPDFNRPAFKAAAVDLRSLGYSVINPAELDDEEKERLSWEGYMRRDIAELVGCERVVVLPGWRESKGASFEVLIARSLGMDVIDFESWELVPMESETAKKDESILEEAQRLVLGDRGKSYGPPSRDFERVAALWSPIIGATVKAEQIPLCMVALKISRQCNSPKRDNWTDMAGYAQCGAMVDEEAGRI